MGRKRCTMFEQRSQVSVAMVVLLVVSAGLYLTMEAWVGEKSQLEARLIDIETKYAEASNTLVDMASLKATLESKLNDATAGRDRLLSEHGRLKADHATAEAQVTTLEEQVRSLAAEKVDSEIESRGKFEELVSKTEKTTGRIAHLESSNGRCWKEHEKLMTEYSEAKRRLAKLQGDTTEIDSNWVPEFRESKVPVWVWWEFGDGIPTAYRLNLRTWLRHMPASKFELHLLNKNNIKDYYPDITDAFYRMYSLAQSDFVRSSMLALHGGVYLDGDMMLREDLDVVFKDVWEGNTDVMPYLFDFQKCRESFSTNFMAGKKGNLLSASWHDKVTSMLGSKCPKDIDPNNDGNYVFTEERACCLDKNSGPRKRCYVAFGAVGDRTAHNVMKVIDKDGPENSELRMTCIEKYWGMAANASGCNGELLWKEYLQAPPDGFVPPTLPFGQIPEKDRRSEKCWKEGKDMRCTASGLYPNFFRRHGFHLFNSFNSDLMFGFKTDDELLASGSVIAELYKEALVGEQEDDPRYAALGIRNRNLHDNDRSEFKMWGDTQQIKMPWLADTPGFAERIAARRKRD